jgi:hypothetical protein
MPSKRGLKHDSGEVLACAECGLKYRLHCDGQAEMFFTFCSVLASEIITARHPHHDSNVTLELSALRRQLHLKHECAWSVRREYANLNGKPYLILGRGRATPFFDLPPSEG